MTKMFDATRLDSSDAVGLIDDILTSVTECSMVGADPDGNIFLWNEGARRLYGWAPDEVVGKANIDILHTPEEVSDGLLTRILTTALDRGRWEGTVSRVHKDGTHLVVHVVATSMGGVGPIGRGVLLVGKDASAELRLTHDRHETPSFTRMFEGSMSPLVITDPIGTVVDANFLMESLTGRTRGELIGSSFRDLFTDARKADAVTGLALRDGRLTGCELTLRRREDEANVICNAATVYDATGKLYGLFIAVIDITEQKRYRGELEVENAQLERRNQGKDSFLATMSHELRTPISIVLGFTSILLKDPGVDLSEKNRKLLKTVESAGQHQLAIVNDLLDLARITSGNWTGDFRRIGCRVEAEELVAQLSVLAQAKGIGLRAVTPAAEISIVTDPRTLRQILFNLAGNAIKFTAKGEVRVEVHRRRRDGGSVAFDVVDTGIGIRPEDQARMFEAFEQARRDNMVEGTGLGLFVSQRLASQLGGVITFKSELGKGSVFTLALPVRPNGTGRSPQVRASRRVRRNASPAEGVLAGS